MFKVIQISVKVVISIPHCGIAIPGELKYDLAIDRKQAKRGSDLATDRLFALSIAGRIIRAEISRYIVDLNRARDNFTEQGVILKKDFNGKKVLKTPLTPEQTEERLQKYYDPFYSNIDSALVGEERVLLIDGHSFDSIGPEKAVDAGKKRPEIMLGTNSFKTVSKPTATRLKALLEAKGFKVKIDNPYGKKGVAGITMRYGNPPAVEAVLIEVRKDLYMNEETLEIDTIKIAKLRDKINSAVLALVEELDMAGV